MAETVGWLVDKICIAELKIFHMQEQAARADAPDKHRQTCRERVAILRQQKADLVSELNDLLEQWRLGHWAPKVYRQFKMYNDPAYNTPAPRRA